MVLPMGNDLVMNDSALLFTVLPFKQLFSAAKIYSFAFKNNLSEKNLIRIPDTCGLSFKSGVSQSVASKSPSPVINLRAF